MKTEKIKRTLLISSITLLIVALIGLCLYNYQRYLSPTQYMAYRPKGDELVGTRFVPLRKGQGTLKQMDLALENSKLRLYIHPETAEVAIEYIETGAVIYSNPQGRDDDVLANPANKALLSSQFNFVYYDAERRRKTMNSYSDATVHGQFSIEAVDGGIRVNYDLGNPDTGIERLPKYLTEERLETRILSYLETDTQKRVKRLFVPSKEKVGFLEMRSQVGESQVALENMLAAFEQAGYTEEELVEDNLAAGVETNRSKIHFTIPLVYKLEGAQLSVSLDVRAIEEPEGVRITMIQLMNYMGAGSMEDHGYLVVPSGSGGVIEFNNAKTQYDDYFQPIYGADPVMQNRLSLQQTRSVRMPIFGLKNGDVALLAEINKGSALAGIRAHISGKTNSYNAVFPSFNIREFELLSMFGATGDQADLPTIEENRYPGTIEVIYSVLVEEDANYAGMAKVYRESLEKEEVLRGRATLILPLYLDILGVIEKKSFIMGMPYLSNFVMTTPEEAMQIVGVLQDEWPIPIHLRYLGWTKGGYYHDVARKVAVAKGIGGQGGLSKFKDDLQRTGGALFLDLAFTQVSHNAKGYSDTFESSRHIAGVPVTVAPYHPSITHMFSYFKDDLMRIVSPVALMRHVETFSTSFNKSSLGYLSLRDLGDVLASDKKRQRTIDREWSMHIAESSIKKLSKPGEPLMIEGGNAYAWAAASDIVNIPVEATGHHLIDHSIPWMQMVLHGHINLASAPLNSISVSNRQDLALKLIAFGTAPRYLFGAKETAELMNTPFQRHYSTEFTEWTQEALMIYHQVSKALAPVAGQKMLDYESIVPGVSRTVYDNGVEIYVNQTQEEFLWEGITLKGKSTLTVGGGTGD